jgi:hypothetical protein
MHREYDDYDCDDAICRIRCVLRHQRAIHGRHRRRGYADPEDVEYERRQKRDKYDQAEYEFPPWLNNGTHGWRGCAGVLLPKQHQRGIARAFMRYCLTLRREILFPLGWFGSSATQMTRRSPYRQLEESGVA